MNYTSLDLTDLPFTLSQISNLTDTCHKLTKIKHTLQQLYTRSDQLDKWALEFSYDPTAAICEFSPKFIIRLIVGGKATLHNAKAETREHLINAQEKVKRQLKALESLRIETETTIQEGLEAYINNLNKFRFNEEATNIPRDIPKSI